MTTGSVRGSFTQFLPRLAAGLRVTGVSRATVETSRVAQFVVPPRTSVPRRQFDIVRLEKLATELPEFDAPKQRFPLLACAKLLAMLKVCNFNGYEGLCSGLLLIDGWAATCKSLAPKCYPTERSVLHSFTNQMECSTIFPQVLAAQNPLKKSGKRKHFAGKT